MLMKILGIILPVFRKRKNKARSQAVKKDFVSLEVSYRFCFLAVVLFCLQGLISNLGAIDMLFPDLPTPVSFQAGRSVHLNLSLFWTMIGAMGAAFYFTIQECSVELFSQRLAKLQFWLLLVTVLGILTSLAFGITEGREYLEALWVFKIGIALTLLLFVFNIGATMFKGRCWAQATVLTRVIGSFTLLILFIPNIFHYNHPTTDDMVRFWVVHMWEEVSFELIGGGLTGALLIYLFKAPPGKVANILYLELALAAVSGIFATGHHYYWIGTTKLWIYIGSIFSILQVVPVLLMVYTTIKSVQQLKISTLTGNRAVTLFMLASSLFHHLLGAAALGLFMSVPRINLFFHGTFMTSSHAHFALFGALGFLVLTLCYFILTEEQELALKKLMLSGMAVVILNMGLMVMASALFLAGLLQGYLVRAIGMEFMEVQNLVRPLLFIRAFGGLTYGLGAVLLTWSILPGAWNKLKSKRALTGSQY